MNDFVHVFANYFCLSGIIIWYFLRPSQVDKSYEKWCKSHKDDEDFVSKSHYYATLIDGLQNDQSIIDILALLGGFILLPMWVLYSLESGIAKAYEKFKRKI